MKMLCINKSCTPYMLVIPFCRPIWIWVSHSPCRNDASLHFSFPLFQAVGMLYLHEVLKPIINRIFDERKYIELDPCKINLNRTRYNWSQTDSGSPASQAVRPGNSSVFTVLSHQHKLGNVGCCCLCVGNDTALLKTSLTSMSPVPKKRFLILEAIRTFVTVSYPMKRLKLSWKTKVSWELNSFTVRPSFLWTETVQTFSNIFGVKQRHTVH